MNRFRTIWTGVILLLAGVVCGTMAAASGACADIATVPHRMTESSLEQKARRLEAIVESRTVQPHGLIPMFVRANDYQLPTADDYRGAYKHRHLFDKTEAEIGIPPMHVWRAWEDSSANTGFYLGAMSYQYRCTQEPRTLVICRRTLRAIQFIHDLAVEKGEKGFLCKPYGGAYSNQTSGDQVQCVVTALAAYRPIAPPEDLAIIDTLIRSFADHQIAIDYQPLHGYFAYPRGTWGWKDWDWGDGLIYAPLMYFAWNTSGDPKFIHEVHRWYEHCGLNKKTPPPSGKMIRGTAGYRTLYLPAIMMEFDPQHYELWRSFMVDCYQRSKTGILPDGTSYTSWEYDTETSKTMPLASGWGGGPTRTGRSAIFAKGCVAAQRWLPDEDLLAVARTILEGLDEPTFRFVMPAAPDQQLPAEWQPEARLLDHAGLTAWLWAFWEGRWRGYW